VKALCSQNFSEYQVKTALLLVLLQSRSSGQTEKKGKRNQIFKKVKIFEQISRALLTHILSSSVTPRD